MVGDWLILIWWTVKVCCGEVFLGTLLGTISLLPFPDCSAPTLLLRTCHTCLAFPCRDRARFPLTGLFSPPACLPAPCLTPTFCQEQPLTQDPLTQVGAAARRAPSTGKGHSLGHLKGSGHLPRLRSRLYPGYRLPSWGPPCCPDWTHNHWSNLCQGTANMVLRDRRPEMRCVFCCCIVDHTTACHLSVSP